ncbi:hypothetical protein NQ315_015944 [Exocentrus adspersus]|uniref:RNase H type-1 domain-containing protein n=1 Tax=Exocentrus adspersus TaxID=1586481 RepID=A0AAV8VBT1_9CUCU|nr:hypothetical protein NQ315_015944 [Exocentrus adspersus]
MEGIEIHSVLGMVSDGLPTRINLELPYNILLPGRDEWDWNRTNLLRADSSWYTDGSKTQDGVEATAQEGSSLGGEALGSYRCTSEAVWNYQQTLSRVGRTNRLTLVWIPGHVGLRSNEVADSLARRGAASEFIGPEPVLGLSYSTARLVIRTWAEGDTLQYWRSRPGLAHSKRFMPSPSKARSKKLLELSRINLRALRRTQIADCAWRMKRRQNTYYAPARRRTRFTTLGKVQLLPEDQDKYSPNKIIDFLRRLDLMGEAISSGDHKIVVEGLLYLEPLTEILNLTQIIGNTRTVNKLI